MNIKEKLKRRVGIYENVKREKKEKKMKCSECGKQLKQSVPLDHPMHVFRKPKKIPRKFGRTHIKHIPVCRECFNKRK